jgi:hypothetical protein
MRSSAIWCFAGLSGSRRTIRFGTRPSLRRTGRILITSAKYLGTAQRDNYFGSGLGDPLAAIQAENNFLAPRAMTLPQAHARSSTILIDEFDAALF